VARAVRKRLARLRRRKIPGDAARRLRGVRALRTPAKQPRDGL